MILPVQRLVPQFPGRGRQGDICGDRSRLEQEQSSLRVRPFDVDGLLVQALDVRDESREFEDLCIGQRERIVTGVGFLFRAAIRHEPYRRLFFAEGLALDLESYLVDEIRVGCRRSGNNGLAKTPIRVDNRLVIVVRHGVQRESNSSDLACNLFLDDHRDFGVVDRKSVLSFVHHDAVIEAGSERLR